MWKELNSLQQLDNFLNSSQTIIIFKHSTRCPVSAMAKRSLEFDQELLPANSSIYYLDLIAFREISNTIEEKWAVKHESPQLLLIKGNKCIYNASHSEIEMRDIISFIS